MRKFILLILTASMSLTSFANAGECNTKTGSCWKKFDAAYNGHCWNPTPKCYQDVCGMLSEGRALLVF